MKIVVIGGTGHIGTYLVPRLVALGHEVVSVSRGRRDPYHAHGAWQSVYQVELDRKSAEAEGTFGSRIASLEPQAVIDLICFTAESSAALADALAGRIEHVLHCGTIWVHGPSEVVPTTEDRPRRPLEAYGRRKAAIEADLLGRARRDGFPATVLHPGHIVGPGWTPVGPAGNTDPEVWRRLARGETLALPNLGMETLHHVHADDVAGAFERALANWSAAVGESFHVVSPRAVTLRGFAEAAARWFGREARLEFRPLPEWRETLDPDQADRTENHISHSPNCSMEKARRRLGYRPRYESLEAVRESLDWAIDHGLIEV